MITEQVGNRIRFLRNQMGLSQEKLALKAGIDRTYLAGIESGKRNATITSIEKIVNALEISLREFFDFDSDVDYK
jgi:transcriptional regulator with XRE-family HTH domain